MTLNYVNSRADEAGRISNQAIATDTGTGVASGAILGAAWGLTCGPFFWLCSPLGALAGATTGATAGFVVGVLESLPEEKVQALSDQITGYLALQDPQQQFHAALLNRTAGEWHVVAQAADKNLEISLENLSLRTHRQ